MNRASGRSIAAPSQPESQSSTPGEPSPRWRASTSGGGDEKECGEYKRMTARPRNMDTVLYWRDRVGTNTSCAALGAVRETGISEKRESFIAQGQRSQSRPGWTDGRRPNREASPSVSSPQSSSRSAPSRSRPAAPDPRRDVAREERDDLAVLVDDVLAEVPGRQLARCAEERVDRRLVRRPSSSRPSRTSGM